MATNYAAFLRSLLLPTGMYGRKPGSYALADAEALGGALDSLADGLDLFERDSMADTAAEEGLAARRALFPFLPEGLRGGALRRAVMALLAVGDTSFTTKALCAALAGCGLPAAVRETDRPQTVRVEFPGLPGIPAGFERIRPVIEDILPAHVEVEYLFWFAVWSQWEERNPTWRAWDSAGTSWVSRETDV